MRSMMTDRFVDSSALPHAVAALARVRDTRVSRSRTRQSAGHPRSGERGYKTCHAVPLTRGR